MNVFNDFEIQEERVNREKLYSQSEQLYSAFLKLHLEVTSVLCDDKIIFSERWVATLPQQNERIQKSTCFHV